MRIFRPHATLVVLASLALVFSFAQAEKADIAGSWIIDPGASDAIDPFRRIQLNISLDDEDLTIERIVSAGRRGHTNTYTLKVGEEVSIDMGWWTGNRHIGAYMDRDTKGLVRTDWLDEESVLRIQSRFVLITSQGKTPVRTYEEYRLSPDGDEMTVIQIRSSRNKPIVHVFRKS